MRAIALSGLVLLACAGEPPTHFERGKRYPAALRVTERGPVLPELAARLPSPVDTATLEFVVTAVRGDSAYGQVAINLHALGTMGGRAGAPDAPYNFAARVIEDSVEMRLDPGATDSDVWFWDRWQADKLVGRWATSYSPRLSGTLTITQ